MNLEKIEIKKANDTSYQIKREDGKLFYINVTIRKNKKLIDFLMGKDDV